MQTLKEGVRNKIIEVSRELFFENGYRKTSMRIIAKEANVTLSNIYNYFKNKDEILEVILQPVLSEMEELFDLHDDPNYTTTNWFEIEDIGELVDLQNHIQFIISNRRAFDMLFHKCSGSKYENIKDYFIDRYTESSRNYLQLMKDKYPQVNKDISDFFLHILAAWWIQILSEVASHELDEEEITRFVKEYITFGTGGWKRLMNL